ncbi:putative death-receptor fusion protein-domain-containing protein [Cadophora sp. MPI-SDFR-AT-0126]|nr:putative death-receptor fusion protein-domain-containing protein [Leotiomycetes sp. MPI-SDFR-AT-0126]
MSIQLTGETISPSLEMTPPSDDRVILKWLESQPTEAQSRLTQELFDGYLAKAAQPRHISGNGCIKLCYFIEQCMRSKSSFVRDTIFAENPCLELFKFYIEWNEKNQARSMRQIMELISTMIAKNPSEETKLAIKKAIMKRDIAIVTHQAAQPLVKPAFKSLESLMGKATITAKDLLDAYQERHAHGTASSDLRDSETEFSAMLKQEVSTEKVQDIDDPEASSWDSFFSDMFDWMTHADISPAAGKFLVTVFRDLRTASSTSISSTSSTASWQRWIRRGLGKNPEALENVKNYLFPPLFKLDRVGSLSFLEELSKNGSIEETQSQEIDAQSLLQLSAMETGKKAGLVEEPDTVEFSKVSKKPSGAVVLQEDSIGLLLTHDSETVRSLAFSVLVSSSSTIRPFSQTALNVLKANMYVLFCDTDAKFRNEILSSTKHMVERLRGATSLLAKEVNSLSFQLNGNTELPTAQQEESLKRLHAIKYISRAHNDFVTWYLKFLLLELVPTASYQRHITSLKAISIFLRSGILKHGLESQLLKTSGNNTVWPYNIVFFTRTSMRLLMDLLMDPFEDVRSGATSILKLASPSDFESESSAPTVTKEDEILPDSASSDLSPPVKMTSEFNIVPLGLLVNFIARAEDLSKETGRADHADGVARSYELLYGLQASPQSRLALIKKLVDDLGGKIEVAEHSLGQAVFEAPIHGNFAALTFVWDSINFSKDFEVNAIPDLDYHRELETLQHRMASYCSRVWQAVKDILCNDSPEGYLPEELDELEDVDTKDVLSYSFRAVHESSNLMRSLVNTIKLKLQAPENKPILPTATFVQIANLSFEQLTTLRHRGAFSTVTLTFAVSCQACLHANMDPTSRELLAAWLKAIFECIENQDSTTRRSAGIPAAITSILSAKATTPSLNDVVRSLTIIAQRKVAPSARDDTKYPQVHALNSLKEIVKSAGLGNQVEEVIGELFALGGSSFQNEAYPIRNCGLLLIRSLFDLIFGTNTEKAVVERGWDGRSTMIEYSRYPALVELIIGLLKLGTDDALFPAMDVLRRAGPPPAHRRDIESLVHRQLANRNWQVRRIAADCLCSFSTEEKDWIKVVIMFLESEAGSSNQRHGQLLVIRAILSQRLDAVKQNELGKFLNLLPTFSKFWHKDLQQYRNPWILILYGEIRQQINRKFCSLATSSWRQGHNVLRANAGLLTLQAIDLQSDFKYTRSPFEIAKNPDLCKLVAQNDLSSLAVQNDLNGLLLALAKAMSLSPLAAVAFLEAIPDVFRVSDDGTTLLQLCLVYVAAMESTVLNIQVAALRGLCVILDRHFPLSRYRMGKYSKVMDVVLRTAGKSFYVGSPTLTIARLEMNGWISLFKIIQRIANAPTTYEEAIVRTPEFLSWSLECMMYQKDDEEFDTRFAAAKALSKFYIRMIQALHRIPKSEHLIPSLFALYDILNDDDSEIRKLASEAISIILNTQLVPQAATSAFANHLFGLFISSQIFIKYVVAKMTGTPTNCLGLDVEDPLLLLSVENQYFEARPVDNTLFAQEKQNLWKDEIEDAKIWATIFGKLRAPSFGLRFPERPLHPVLVELVAWVKKALTTLKKSATTNDGALGWTTKPEVFAVSMRAIHAINSVMNYLEVYFLPAIDRDPAGWSSTGTDLLNHFESIVLGVEDFVRQCLGNRVHPILVQTIMARVPQRPEVCQRFEILQQRVKEMGQMDVNDLVFPLQNGTRS